jgi:hypothetical protein
MASMKSYPSRELRRLRREWLGRNRVLVAGVTALFVASGVVAVWWGHAFANAFGWYAIGALHAGLAATLLHMLNMAVLAHDPRAIYQLRGAWGEDNTRSELETATRKKLVWGWIDSIPLQGGDLDHVVVTRSGGIVVLDSKFHTKVTTASVAEMTAGAVRARLRAEALSRSLLKADKSGRHRASIHSVTVTPCIVLWGPARADVPRGHVVDGVHFVDGRRLREWIQELPVALVSKHASRELLAGLAKRRDATPSPT